MRWRWTVLTVAAALCGVLASCSSAATATGGGTSPGGVVTAYFSALVGHRWAAARRLVCPSGWKGDQKLHFTWTSVDRPGDPTKPTAGSFYLDLRPRTRQVRDGWLVSLERETGLGSLPLFRVIQNGGRYFVCGYVER